MKWKLNRLLPMPKEIADKRFALYETDGGLIGDKVAYIRYFMPFGAYTCYVLEADKKTEICLH